MLALLDRGSVLRLQLAQTLAGLAGRFAGHPALALADPGGCLHALAHLAQAAYQAAHLPLALADRGFQCLAPLLLQSGALVTLLTPALQQLLMQQLGAGQQGRRRLRRLLLLLALLLQPFNDAIDIAGAAGLQLAGGVSNHLGLQPQPRRNGEGIAAPRNPPLQVIGGGKGVDIKGHRGILKAVIGVLEGLQFAEMGGRHRQPGPISQVAQQGRRQGGTLLGVGAGPHLIEQHQVGPLGGGADFAGQGIENAGDAPDVAAEGREVLLQRLLVADIGQNLAAPGQPGGAAAGQKQAAAGHQCRQAQAFEGHRFAAGVRAGDRHHPQGRCHRHGHGHHAVPPLLPLLPQQQRMAQIAQLKGAAGIGVDFGSDGPQPEAITGPG